MPATRACEHRAGRRGAACRPARRPSSRLRRRAAKLGELGHRRQAEAVGVGGVDAPDQRVDQAVVDLGRRSGRAPDAPTESSRPAGAAAAARRRRGRAPQRSSAAGDEREHSGRARPSTSPSGIGWSRPCHTKAAAGRRGDERRSSPRRRGEIAGVRHPARGRRRRPRRPPAGRRTASCAACPRAGRRRRAARRRSRRRRAGAQAQPTAARRRSRRRCRRRRRRRAGSCRRRRGRPSAPDHAGVVVHDGGAGERQAGRLGALGGPRCRGRRAPRGGRPRTRRRRRARRRRLGRRRVRR